MPTLELIGQTAAPKRIGEPEDGASVIAVVDGGRRLGDAAAYRTVAVAGV